VGWISSEQSELAVAIRSALIRDKRMVLSAGAGIIRESQPEAEWEEIQSKMNLFHDILAFSGY
jgi:menaquinone-specific isochorismate synthase